MFTCKSIVAIMPSVLACSKNSGKDFARNMLSPYTRWPAYRFSPLGLAALARVVADSSCWCVWVCFFFFFFFAVITNTFLASEMQNSSVCKGFCRHGLENQICVERRDLLGSSRARRLESSVERSATSLGLVCTKSAEEPRPRKIP